MTERRRRFQRDREPGGLVLTDRDLLLLRHCYEHQWLTRPQLQRLIGIRGVTRINQRLRQLYDHGLLQRVRAGTVGAGLQPVYTAGEAAVPLLATLLEEEAAILRRRVREDAGASALLLPHDLQVNDVRIALTEALARTREARLDRWWNARQCYDAARLPLVVRPDGYFRCWQEELLHACYLEVDRGAVSLARWAAKVARYQEYRETGGYNARTGLERFRVLTVAPDRERLERLRTATERVTRRSYWFSTLPEVLALSDLFQPVWLRVGTGGRHPLLSPGKPSCP